MVRTLDGKARAFLSDRYRRLDNEDLAEAVFPVLASYPGLEIKTAEVTETRLYISATYPNLKAEIKAGDVIEAGIHVRNSEIGAGTYEIAPFTHRLICANGMKHKNFGLSKNHVGRRAESEEEVSVFYSDETKKLDDAALFSKTKDVVNGILSGATFDSIVNEIRRATLDTIPDVEKTIEVVATNYQLNENERKGVLRNIIQEGNLSRYGIANGITNVANDTEDYDRSMELQAFGGKVIDLTSEEWRQLAS